MTRNSQSQETEHVGGILHFSRRSTPLGNFTLLGNAGHILGAYFEGQRHFPRDTASWRQGEDLALFHSAWAQLDEYFHGTRTQFELPLRACGTPFQMRVWQLLREIGPGQTTTYAGLACSLGNPRAVRAVGAAVGRNPHSVLVPCHRVLGSNGSLTGYAGGMERKSALLSLEGVPA